MKFEVLPLLIDGILYSRTVEVDHIPPGTVSSRAPPIVVNL